VRLSHSTDDTGDAFYSDHVTTLQLQLPVILRCHVMVQSANHITPNVTLSFDDEDMTSEFVRSTTFSVRSQDGGSLMATDYMGDFEWNVTLKQLIDLHTCNWTCRATMSYYPPLVTSSRVYVASNQAAIYFVASQPTSHLGSAVVYIWYMAKQLFYRRARLLLMMSMTLHDQN